MDILIEIARGIRHGLYALTSLHVFGIEFDIVLHFVIGAVIFAIAQARLGTRRAAQLLAALMVAKEIVDLFLKSQVRYILGNISRAPTAMFVDIGLDLLTGAVGGLVAWFCLRQWRRLRDHSSSAHSGPSLP